jgi:hypothetical protein
LVVGERELKDASAATRRAAALRYNGPMSERKDLPPPPERPEPDECCGGGCTPCIMDYYEEALERWRREVEAIERERERAKVDPSREPR